MGHIGPDPHRPHAAGARGRGDPPGGTAPVLRYRCAGDALWHERYVGHADPEIQALVDGRHYDLYVLCGDEIPLEDDGVRDTDELRSWMQQRFRDELKKRPEPWIEVHGTVDQRIAAVSAEIDRLGLLRPDAIDPARFG